MSAKILNYISNRLHAKRIKLLCTRCYTEVVTESKKYTDTINLPKTAFPLRLNSKSRVLNDEYIRENCGFDQLYSWQREHLEGPEFILHDGPPYANGEPHMGHAINKILKDITLRRRVISGQRVHYVPGWDCHGLPIEMKALARDGGSDLDPLEIRKRARQFALNTIKSQQEAFKSWGIMGEWTTEGTYRTLDPEYIKQQLGAFWELHEKGLIYRDLKPVYWSPSSRTALAEAELEYDNNHISPSLTFQVRLVDLPPNIQNIVGTNTPVWALVWTTTPWTLPSNQAICYNENMVYSLVEIDGRPGLFLVATELIDDLQTLLEKRISVDNNFLGTTCAGITYIPPFGTRVQPFLPSNHVSLSKGTGLVHAAPAHGPDDFLVAKSNKMSLKCVVDETGCYTCDAPDFLHGLSVITEGTEAVLNSIQENIVHLEMLTHKYPIDWRTKEPVILRASYQWFIDTDKLKEIAVNELEAVNVHPNHSSFSNTRGLLAQLRKRPYWCISRQRAWGVPIPVLYNKRTGDPIMHKDLVDHVISLVDSESGLDAWWRLPVEDLIPANVLNALGVPITDIVKGQDILDIWLDSGVSWLGVLGRDKVADLYLEGVDQFTGWFQSSLMTSVALRGKAPYKNVFVHGFAVDEHGLKMSKSMGNVIHPFQITNGGREEPALGVDALRWWVSSHAPQHATIPVGQGLLQSSVESVQRLRLVLKFLLGAARGPRLDISTVHNCTKLKVLDRYMLHTLALFDEEVSQLYATYQYNRVCSTVADLVAGNLSGFYLHMIKDRLYCDDTEARAGAISVLSASLGVLCKALWPIVPHLVEEAWSHYEENTNNTPMYQNPPQVEQCWFDMHTVGPIDLSLSVRSELHQIAPKQNTWKLHAEITANEEDTFLLKILQPEDHSINSELCDILQVSSVRLVETRFDNPYVLSVTPEAAPLCPRCRRHAVTSATELCTRCVTVLN